MKCKNCKRNIEFMIINDGFKLYNVFPNGLCINCHEKATKDQPLEKPDFIKAINK